MLRSSFASMVGLAAFPLFAPASPRTRTGETHGAPSASDGSGFTLAWVTDTHIRGRLHQEHVIRANRWVIENRERLNIRLVVHTGDVTHNGTDAHFRLAEEAYAELYASGIPVLMAIGNHDYDDELKTGEVRLADRWNRHFGLDKVRGQSWFGEAHEAGRAENYYATFGLGGEKLLLFIIEFGPRDAVLDWVGSVCRRHPEHKALVFTHSYLNEGGRADGGSSDPDLAVAAPSRYRGAGPDVNDGAAMWSKCFQDCPNLVSIHSGHTRPADLGLLPQLAGYRQFALGSSSRRVHEEYHNFQWITYGQRPQYDTRGYLRLMRFDLEANRVTVQTYSPVEERFCEDEKHQFEYAFESRSPV